MWGLLFNLTFPESNFGAKLVEEIKSIGGATKGSILVQEVVWEIFHNGNGTTLFPAVEIKSFALDKFFQHKSYGKCENDKENENLTYGDVFLANVISSIADFTDNICGGECIVLYSVPEAEHFYKRNYFQNFKSFMSPDQSIVNEDCVPMFYML